MSSSARDVKRTESADEQRRRRQDETVAIRKNKRIQSLQKRRAMAAAAPTTTAADAQAVAAGGASANNVVQTTCGASQSNSQGTVASVADLPRIAATLKSMTPDERYEATRSVRRLLSRQEQPPAEAVISAGLVPILVAELGLMTEEKTQFEAAWALTNIASTEHTRVIVTAGAVPYLVKLMMSKNPDIREQCLWCLGNVVGDGHDMRDLVLNVPGSLNNLLMNIKHAATASLLSNATWTLSNFCRGKPQPEIATIQPALPYLAKLITHTSMDIVGDACWALSYISDGDDARIQACVDQGIVSTLVRLLGAEKVSVITPALRTIGNIVSGDDQQTQSVIDAKVFKALSLLLNHSKRTVRKEACWALSNIAAGTPVQVDELMNEKDMLKRVMFMLANDDFEVRKEASWVISNICTGGSVRNIDQLVSMGVLDTICSVLDVNDVKIALVTMEALEAILRKSSNVEYCTMVEEKGGVDKLEELQDHENEDVYRKAAQIIETFYADSGDEDDDDDENGAENQDPLIVPTSTKGSDFGSSFGGFGVNGNSNAGVNPFGVQDTPAAVEWGF